MWQRISSFFRYKRWFYSCIAFLLAFCLSLGIARPSYSLSWLEILLRGAQIIQLSNISDSQEMKIGAQINQQLIRQGKIKIYRNRQVNRYLDRIGQRLARTSKRPNLRYKFQVVDDKSVNAFATMGGYVYINSGLMQKAENEAELASVTAHEIGHIAARHGIKQIRQQAITQGILSAAGLDQSVIVQIGADILVTKPNSREDEFEADNLGLENLKKAGYAPIGMITFMKKLQASSRGKSIPKFLSTHPATEDRIVALEKQIDPQSAKVGDGLDSQQYKQQIRPLA